MLVFRGVTLYTPEKPTINEDVSPLRNYVGDFRYSVVTLVFSGLGNKALLGCALMDDQMSGLDDHFPYERMSK